MLHLFINSFCAIKKLSEFPFHLFKVDDCKPLPYEKLNSHGISPFRFANLFIASRLSIDSMSD